MAINRKPRPTKLSQAKPTDPRAELVRALAESGIPVASACGTCGATVATDDPEAVQTTRQVGTYPYSRQVRSWRLHRVCSVATSGPELLALMLDPTARPVRVGQEHADVARRIGAPLAYHETDGSKPTDRGQRAWKHVPRAELEELKAAVAQRQRELTVPVPHASGWPCSVCGRSHELTDAWGDYQGRPACGGCSRLIERAKVPGNRGLEEYAREAVLAEARNFLPARAVVWPLPLAREMDSYRRLGDDERREPWSYVADLPEAPLTPEERLAELEKLVGVTG